MVNINTLLAGKASIQFSGGDPLLLIGIITIPMPFRPINFHIIAVNTPFLLCLTGIDRLLIRFDNLANTVLQSNIIMPIVCKWGYLQLRLGQPKRSLTQKYLINVKVRGFYRRFGHLFIQRLYKVRYKASYYFKNAANKILIKYCYQC